MDASERTGHPGPAVGVDHVEPVPRRVRASVGGRVVVDTVRALYLWEWPFYPQFCLPVDDVLGELVDEGPPEETPRGTVVPVGLRVDGVERPGAGRRHVASAIPGLAGTVRLSWGACDAWFEEDEEVFVHPRNPYVRVDALRSRRPVRVELDGLVLAESDAVVMLFETGLPTRYYLDRADVDLTLLEPSTMTTACPYKGRTTDYWSVLTGTGLHPDLAWSYAFPAREVLPIAGLVAFYDELVDVTVDGVRQPRPVTHFAT